MAALRRNARRVALSTLVALLILVLAIRVTAPLVATAATPNEQVVNVLVAVDIIDSAGFHGIATDLAEATEISSRLAGTMGKVLTVASAASWPPALDAEVNRFIADLSALKIALESDDLPLARSASEAVHGSQHDLSNAAYGWLTGRSGGSNRNATMPSTVAAIDIVDSAGFHGIATDLADATEISPRLAGSMGKVLIAANAAVWPSVVRPIVEVFIADLTALKAALEADDLELARSASEAIHGSQHALSSAVYAWLEAQPAGVVHGSVDLDLACTVATIDLIDSAGFHGIASDLADATEISSRLAGTMGKVLAAGKAAAWPAEVQLEANRFVADLTAFKAALEADDLEQARATSEAIHGSQHDLSKVTYEWIEATFVGAQVPVPPAAGDAGLLTQSASSRWLLLGLTALTLVTLAAGRLTTRQRSDQRRQARG